MLFFQKSLDLILIFWLRLCHYYVTEKRMLSMHCNVWQHVTQLISFRRCC